MSITAYTGLPGSGKSYGVVAHVILPALKSGRRVVTNVPLKLEAIAEQGWPGVVHVCDAEELKGDEWWQELEGGEVLVLDECWRVWPAGVRANKASEVHKSAFAEHRHRVDAEGLAMEVVLVTQDLAQLSAWVRQLVERTYRSVKLGAVGADKKYRIDVYDGAVDGQRPPESRRLSQDFGSYSAGVWAYYTSHTQSKTGEAGEERRTDLRGVVWRSPMFIGGAGFVVFAIVLVVVYGRSVFNVTNVPVEAAEAGAPVSGVPLGMVPVDLALATGEWEAEREQLLVDIQIRDERIRELGDRLFEVENPPPPPRSPYCRVSGSFEVAGPKSCMVVLSCREGVRHMAAKECSGRSIMDWECEVDGYAVTRYTGFSRGIATAESATGARAGQRTPEAAFPAAFASPRRGG